jgi:ABC-type uncharacterized transport system substrate-binding protein
MFKLIEDLRKKSNSTKKQIAFLVSFTFVGIIAVVWFTTLLPQIKPQKGQEATVSRQEPSPISTFSDSVVGSIFSITEQLNLIKSTFKNFTTDPAYYVATSTLEDIKN